MRFSQLQEVYGLDSSGYDMVKDRFFVDDGMVSKLCLNTAPWIDLKRHPYIGYDGARAIDTYRRHNVIDSIAQLATRPNITDSLFQLWQPYLKICEDE